MSNKVLKFVSKFHNKEFMLIDDSNFLYLENKIDENDKIIRQEIKYVSVMYSLF